MKIKEIAITNFKGIKDITYTPENKTAVLIGKNGLGKTSFLEAVRFAITGNAPDGCIRDGEDYTTVSVVLADGTSFSRTKHVTKPTKVTVNGKNTPAKNLDELIETITGVNKDAMKITTSAEIIAGLNASEFGDFIMNFIPEKLDIDTLCSYIPGLSTEGEIELSIPLPPMPAKFGIETIKNAYDYLFLERKTIKKELDNRKAQDAAFTEGIAIPRDIAVIDADLEKVMKVMGSLESAKTAIKMYKIALANKEKAEREIDEMKAQVAAITASKPNPAILSDISTKKKECRQAIINAERMKQTIVNTIALLENTIANLGKPVCPLTEKLICTTDKTGVKDELIELLEANKEGLAIQEDIISVNNTAIADLDAREKEYRTNEIEYNKKVVLASRLEKAKLSVPKVPAEPAGVEEKDYSAEIKKLQVERDSFYAFEQHKKMLAVIENLQKRYDLLCFLVKALEPKGSVMDAVTAHYTSILESVINKRAAELRTGFSVKFANENGMQYWIQTDSSKEFREYTSLSKGEQCLSMFLIMDMINSLTGAKLLLIDDMNHLDADSLTGLFTLLQSSPVQDEYDHIILCSVDNKDAMDIMTGRKDADYIY